MTPTVPSSPPDELDALGEWIGDLIQEFDEHPDDDVRERVFALLDGVDALHRAALGRLVALLKEPDAATTWSRAQRDPLIRTVLALYDLAPVTEPKRFPPSRPPQMTIPLTMVQSSSVLPVGMTSRAPEWHEVERLFALPPETMSGIKIADRLILLCNIGGEIFAYDDACPDTPLTLSNGQLESEQIVCPWHGCRFDARSGQRMIHRGTNLIPYPVTIEGDVVRVALNLRGST